MLKLDDIKKLMSEINDEIIGFYEDNSDEDGNLLVVGFENNDEFIEDLILGLREGWLSE
jgi:hypothetical protein